MSKKSYFVLFLLIVGLSIYYKLDKLIEIKAVDFINNAKYTYIEKIASIENYIKTHFYQIKTIEELRAENKELIEYKMLYQGLLSELRDIQNIKEIAEEQPLGKISIVKVLSYNNFYDFTKVIMENQRLSIVTGKIGGLISENYAAGILIKEDEKLLGLLNGNAKANYAVFIGDIKAPGITHNIKNKKNILVRFIPNWLEVKAGDEVVTSGMDGIFFEGLKVGKVLSVKTTGDTQEAVVEPYAEVGNKSFYYLYY